MAAGRKPTPTAVKELRGNPGKRPLNEREPKGRRASGRAPRGLSEGAGAFWRKYAPRLVDMGVLCDVDEPLLQLAAEHYSLAIQARAEIAESGLTQVDEKLVERKHPLLQVFRDNSAAYRACAAELGMTPSARSKVRIEQEDQLSMTDILFAKVAEVTVVAANPLDEFGDGGDAGE